MAQTNHGIHSAPLPDMANIDVDDDGVLGLLVVQNDEVNKHFFSKQTYLVFLASSTWYFSISMLKWKPLWETAK